MTQQTGQSSNPKRRALVSSAILGLAYASESILPFARSMILARLLSVDDFGLALSLSVVAAIADISTDVGIQHAAVRTDAANARARATLHSLALSRGIVVGGITMALAPAIAMVFGRPDAMLAFAVPGLCIIIRSLYDLGIKQAGRNYAFSSEALTLILAQLAWTVGTVATAFILRDYRSMVVGLLLHAVVLVGVSHLLAKERWRLAWDKTVVAETVAYGRPLLPNGIALALTSMGDRFAVGTLLGLPVLALYSTTIMTAMLPRGTLVRYLNSLFLPRFVRFEEAQRDPAGLCRLWTLVVVALACGFAVGFTCFANPLISVAFGHKYDPDQSLVTLIAILIFIRFFVVLPVPPALAAGRTGFILLGSIASGASLAPAIGALLLFQDLRAFVAALILAEMAGGLWILIRSSRNFPFDLWEIVFLLGSSTLTVALAAVLIGLPLFASLGGRFVVFGIACCIGLPLLFVAARRAGFTPALLKARLRELRH